MTKDRKFNFVYLTICKINGKCYVGSHCTDNETLDFNQYYGGGNLIISALKKYKKQNFHRIILKQCEKSLEVRKLEKYYIDLFDTLIPNGYNISPSGGMEKGMFGVHSEETKEKLSKIRIGKEPWNKGKKYEETFNEETTKRIKDILSKKATASIGEKNGNYGNRGEKNPIFGVKKTKEHKDKLSVSKLGNKNPNAGKYKIITPDNREFMTLSATDFIREHPEYNINRFFIYSASKSKEDNYNGWKITKLENNMVT
jgi:group I intron endonuclease